MHILTIAVPVFNEKRHIRGTIENLISISKQFPNQFEILVIDNFSTDGTREYLNEVERLYRDLNFRVIYNVKNMGFNYSCDHAIEQARGEYIWIIGGQDLVFEGSIEKIFSILQNKPNLVIGNARIYDELSDQVINESLWGNVSSDTFTDLEMFFRKLGGPCQALSCNIFNVKQAREVIEIKLISQLWGFFERICDLLLKNESSLKVHFLSEPIIQMLIVREGWQATGIDNSGVVPRKIYGAFNTSLELMELANARFENRPGVLKAFPPLRDFFAIPRTIIVAKSKGMRITKKLLTRSFIAYRRSPSFWLMGIYFLFAPRVVAMAIVKLKFAVHILRKIFGIKTF